MKLSAPKTGQVVTFTTRHRNPGYGVVSDEKYIEATYTNVLVLDRFDWLRSHEFCIPGGRPDFPVSVVSMEQVVNLKGGKAARKVPRDKSVRIRSSTGDGYWIVQIRGGKAVRCECPGFQFRGRCRHLTEAEKKK